MTSIAERVYTFRASGDLASRIQEAGVILSECADAAHADYAERIATELALALARDKARFRGIQGNQSAFMREAVELLAGAAAKVASDLRYTDLYAEAAESLTDEEIEFRRASSAQTAQRWRDA